MSGQFGTSLNNPPKPFDIGSMAIDLNRVQTIAKKTEYTAPCDGWLTFNMGVTYSAYYYLTVNGVDLRLNDSYNNIACTFVFLLKKGDKFICRCDNMVYGRFIPCRGVL